MAARNEGGAPGVAPRGAGHAPSGEGSIVEERILPPVDGKVNLLRGDTSEAMEFVRRWAWVHGRAISLTAIPEGGGRMDTRTFGPDEAEACAIWIDARNGQDPRLNLHFEPNPTRDRLDKRAKEEDIEAMVCLHLDVDPRRGKDLKAERRHILHTLTDADELAKRGKSMAPTVINDSGGGYQAF